MPNLLFAFSALFLFAACAGTKSAAGDSTFTSVTLRQGGCFGTCPVYTLAVQPDGSARYTGKRYAPYQGEHLATLSADSLRVLRAAVQSVLAKAEELPREIDSGIADMAMSTITIVDGQDTLMFRGTSEYAPPVAQLRQVLFNIAEHSEWTRSPSAEPQPANQLLITLKAADQLQVVTESYYRQQMKMVRMVNESPPVFLVTFDPYTMSAEEMVRDLKRNPMVVRTAIVENQ